jgi:predicted dehydrogenase
MPRHPDIDLVCVVVRVPYHHEIVMAALEAGKKVFCEWPLAATVEQAREISDLARDRSLLTLVGLQGRSDPALMYTHDLIEDGYVGEVFAVNMTAFGGGGLDITSDRVWRTDRRNGANTMTIAGGHSIDALCFCVGEFAEVSANVATLATPLKVKDTGETIDVTSPDNILVNGVLANGGLASIHIGSMPANGSGWRLEIYGREGSIHLNGASQAQMGTHRVYGARGGQTLERLNVPDKYNLLPEGSAEGQAFNVGQGYARLADAIQNRSPQIDPDFALALKRHELLDAIQRSSDAGGKAVSLN